MAQALRLGERQAVLERLAITATVTLDEAGGIPTIISPHLDVTARIPGLDPAGFDAMRRMNQARDGGYLVLVPRLRQLAGR